MVGELEGVMEIVGVLEGVTLDEGVTLGVPVVLLVMELVPHTSQESKYRLPPLMTVTHVSQ